MTEFIIVLPGSSGECDEIGGSFVSQPGCVGDDGTGGASASETDTATTTDSCPSGPSGGSGSNTTGTSGATTAQASGDADGGSGGTCAVDRRNSGFSLLFLGLLGVRRRRRA